KHAASRHTSSTSRPKSERCSGGRLASWAGYLQDGRCLKLFDPLELQIPHTMPQPLATALKLGDRPLFRARYIGAVFSQIAVTRRCAHDFEHMLGIGFPVGSHMEYA